MLDLEGKGNKPQPDWAKNIDLQQYNGLAVVTIPGSALSEFVYVIIEISYNVFTRGFALIDYDSFRLVLNYHMLFIQCILVYLFQCGEVTVSVKWFLSGHTFAC